MITGKLEGFPVSKQSDQEEINMATRYLFPGISPVPRAPPADAHLEDPQATQAVGTRPAVRASPFRTMASSYIILAASQLRAQLEKNLAAVKLIEALDYHPPMERCKALIGP